MKSVYATDNAVQRYELVDPEMMQIRRTSRNDEESSSVVDCVGRRNIASVMVNVPVIP